MPTITLSLGTDLKKRFSLLLVTSVLFDFTTFTVNGYCRLDLFMACLLHTSDVYRVMWSTRWRETCLESQELGFNSFSPRNDVIVTESKPASCSCFIYILESQHWIALKCNWVNTCDYIKGMVMAIILTNKKG